MADRIGWSAIVALMLATPALQGAGCTAHYWPHFKGQVQPDESLRYAHTGHKIVVVYRAHGDGVTACEEFAVCLKQDGWTPLEACKGEDGGGNTTEAVVSEGATAVKFDACAGMLGVNYAADIAAFIDVDENGKPSAGDPYGGFRDGPATRDNDQEPIVIRISETLPE